MKIYSTKDPQESLAFRTPVCYVQTSDKNQDETSELVFNVGTWKTNKTPPQNNKTQIHLCAVPKRYVVNFPIGGAGSRETFTARLKRTPPFVKMTAFSRKNWSHYY